MAKKNILRTIATNDVVVRAVKTAVQAFVAVLVATDVPFSKQALVAAIAAGVSAAYNSAKLALNRG